MPLISFDTFLHLWKSLEGKAAYVFESLVLTVHWLILINSQVLKKEVDSIYLLNKFVLSRTERLFGCVRVSVITLKTEQLTLILNDCPSSGLKLNPVGKEASSRRKTPAWIREPVQSPREGSWPVPILAPGTRRSRTLPARLPKPGPAGSRAEPLPGASGCPSAPRLGRRREGKGPRGRGKTRAGAVVSASPTRAQVPRRGAGVWAAARGGGWVERGVAGALLA